MTEGFIIPNFNTLLNLGVVGIWVVYLIWEKHKNLRRIEEKIDRLLKRE